MKTSRSAEVKRRGVQETRCVVLGDGAGPTEDIYFLKSAAPLLAVEKGVSILRIETRRAWVPKRMRLPALRGAQVLICRSLATPWISFLETHRSSLGRLTYIIDDDLEAGAKTEGLPPAYRDRLVRILELQWPRLINLADELVVTSGALKRRFADVHQRVSLLEPPMILPPPDLTHFETGQLTVGFHGTRAHATDLDRIAPALKGVLESHEQVQFLCLLGRFTPATLRGLSRVHCIEPMPWYQFLSFMSQQRIHVGLVPLFDTPFNYGKSHVKFLEIAAMGGVGVYSRRAPYVDIVEHGVDGLLVDDNPDDWFTSISRLVADPAKTREMAEAAVRKAALIGDPARAASFWQARLYSPPPFLGRNS